MRVMATCREMGIRTVAVYSEVDRGARHVREADEAYYIGPAAASQSYLRIDSIIEVASRSGAEAIHPGYGFLAENPAFAEACEQAGIVFIGPPASAMRLMGSKIAAKRLAQEVGTPIVPGYNGERQDDNTLQREAERTGFPLLIKASAGGGGKGMRTVSSAADFLEQLAGARREARVAFGDETVFLERLILRPRHIEIQVLGDKYGKLIHLGERECSIQRRHQKIIEESPSPALTPTLRASMGDAAIRIAQAAGYVNAGTLEFMLDEENHFYFLEMNTRLQVEHPVTELVSGLDLVRHQLAIAAGEPLALTQEQISQGNQRSLGKQRGHAIEVRIYAEDPAHNFLPSTGTITHFVAPEGPGIRLDSGIERNDEITQYYDPMIAKLIVSGEDRPAAIARLQRALEGCALFGVTTNVELLHAISIHPAFQAGMTHTDFLQEHGLLAPPTEQQEVPEVVLLAAALSEVLQSATVPRQSASARNSAGQQDTAQPWQTPGAWRMVGEARTFTYTSAGREHRLALRPLRNASSTWSVQLDEQPAEEISGIVSDTPLIVLRRGNEQIRAYVQRQQTGQTQVIFAGHTYHLQRRQPPDVNVAAHRGGQEQVQKTLTAPMAGTIVKVHVHEGQAVEAHQPLLVLSAMKMEHAITAPYTGTVGRVPFQEGAVVPGGAVVVEMM